MLEKFLNGVEKASNRALNIGLKHMFLCGVELEVCAHIYRLIALEERVTYLASTRPVTALCVWVAVGMCTICA